MQQLRAERGVDEGAGEKAHGRVCWSRDEIQMNDIDIILNQGADNSSEKTVEVDRYKH